MIPYMAHALGESDRRQVGDSLLKQAWPHNCNLGGHEEERRDCTRVIHALEHSIEWSGAQWK